jgi:hypothetical protein
MGAFRNDTRKPFKKDDKRVPSSSGRLMCLSAGSELNYVREDLEEYLDLCNQDGVAGEDRAVRLPPEAGRLHVQEDAGCH